jgi:hypothetical protein
MVISITNPKHLPAIQSVVWEFPRQPGKKAPRCILVSVAQLCYSQHKPGERRQVVPMFGRDPELPNSKLFVAGSAG